MINNSPKSRLPNLPSFVWVILIPLALIAFILGIVLLFSALATVEGVASIIMILAGFFCFRAAAKESQNYTNNSPIRNIALGVGIVFYALMGMAIDQPGNFILNKPLEYFCPANTSLNRQVDITNPLPGRTDFTQNYQCFNNKGVATAQIDMLQIIGIRFAEYVLIGYLLYYGNKFTIRKNLSSLNQ